MDVDGFLTLKKRSKDRGISSGSKLCPRDVEELLPRHPGVRELSVIGQPDADRGAVVVAFVVGDGLNADALAATCLQHRARFKRPRRYHFVDSLPKNHDGKVLKKTLREPNTPGEF